LSDKELEPVIEKYRQIVVEHGAEVEQAGKWERRRLAYEIKGHREGTYILMNFKSGPEAARELERSLRLDEAILRHIVVRLEPRKSAILRLDKLAEARQAEPEVPAEEEAEPAVAEAGSESPEVEPEEEPVGAAESESAEEAIEPEPEATAEEPAPDEEPAPTEEESAEPTKE